MVTQMLPVFNDSPPKGRLKRQRHTERMEDFWKKSGAFLQVDRPDQRLLALDPEPHPGFVQRGLGGKRRPERVRWSNARMVGWPSVSVLGNLAHDERGKGDFLPLSGHF